MRNQLMRLILKALDAADGHPMPEAAVYAAADLAARPQRPTHSDVQDALNALQEALMIQGITDQLTGRSWTLTNIGIHRARQL